MPRVLCMFLRVLGHMMLRNESTHRLPEAIDHKGST